MKVSAFIPVTNAEKRGDTYIEAIKTHLYWADELVVVDGGSTDETVARIKALNDPRIRVVVEPWDQENWSWAQFAVTWNRGLSECTGDWIAAGESDHIFHEAEAQRVRDELERETKRARIVVKVQKLQSSRWDCWISKSQMYYFLAKNRFPNLGYGYDKNCRTDLCHPIIKDGGQIEGIPTGRAIVEGNGGAELMLGGTGAHLWNYLWTFKTLDQVVEERYKAGLAWNRFKGFEKTFGKKFPTDRSEIRGWVTSQLRSIQSRTNRNFQLEAHPAIMRERIKTIDPNMIGAQSWL